MTAASSDKTAAPAAMPPLSPYIVCRNAERAVDFYVAAFGATVLQSMSGPDGRLFHCTLGLPGGAVLMLTEENPKFGALSPESLKGSPVTLHLSVADCDAAMKRAADAGATVVMPAIDAFWGDRYGQAQDPFGHRWSFGQKLRDVTPEELRAAIEAMAAGACEGGAD